MAGRREESAGAPGVGLFAQLEVDEAFGGDDAGDGADAAEEFQQVLVVLADEFEEDVE